jgi:RimJ/RimL family protein N-acetyltransferase
MVATYSFKNFTELTEKESDEVLKGRNDEEVRRWMTSDRFIRPDEHRQFIVALKQSNSQTYLRVERNGYFAGVYSLNELRGDVAVGGFWVTSYARQRLLSLCVVFQSISHVFERYPIKMIRGYQMINNRSVAKLNSMLGFSSEEEINVAHPCMNYLSLTRDIWLERVLTDKKLRNLIETAEIRNEP